MAGRRFLSPAAGRCREWDSSTEREEPTRPSQSPSPHQILTMIPCCICILLPHDLAATYSCDIRMYSELISFWHWQFSPRSLKLSCTLTVSELSHFKTSYLTRCGEDAKAWQEQQRGSKGSIEWVQVSDKDASPQVCYAHSYWWSGGQLHRSHIWWCLQHLGVSQDTWRVLLLGRRRSREHASPSAATNCTRTWKRVDVWMAMWIGGMVRSVGWTDHHQRLFSKWINKSC